MTRRRKHRAAARWLSCAAFALGGLVAGGGTATQDAAANGETRTLHLTHERTKESGSITFKRNGSYDGAALKQLDWMLRDWRTDEPIRMDPRLFDIIWQVYREVGADEPIIILSAYRSPGTNAMLRRRSRAVSEFSQHMGGKALDFRIPGVSMAQVREIGMRLQQGGVGWYGGASFVHLDSGSVRSWPRMSGGELARLFPDGRTVHIPRDGKPLPGYEDAKAMIIARGGSVAGYAAYAEADDGGPRKSLWATLFGGGDDEDADFYRSAVSRPRSAARGTVVAALPSTTSGEDAGTRGFFAPAPAEPEAVARPRPLPRTQVAAVELPTPAPPPPAAPASPLFAANAAVPPGVRVGAAEAVRTLEAGPVPPRRPEELTVLASTAPLPPLRPATPLAVGGAVAILPSDLRGEMAVARRASAAAGDERAALRALFDAVATDAVPDRRAAVSTGRARPQPPAIATAAMAGEPRTGLRMEFAAERTEEPDSGSFSGPAVKALPTLR